MLYAFLTFWSVFDKWNKLLNLGINVNDFLGFHTSSILMWLVCLYTDKTKLPICYHIKFIVQRIIVLIRTCPLNLEYVLTLKNISKTDESVNVSDSGWFMKLQFCWKLFIVWGIWWYWWCLWSWFSWLSTAWFSQINPWTYANLYSFCKNVCHKGNFTSLEIKYLV